MAKRIRFYGRCAMSGWEWGKGVLDHVGRAGLLLAFFGAPAVVTRVFTHEWSWILGVGLAAGGVLLLGEGAFQQWSDAEARNDLYDLEVLKLGAVPRNRDDLIRAAVKAKEAASRVIDAASGFRSLRELEVPVDDKRWSAKRFVFSRIEGPLNSCLTELRTEGHVAGEPWRFYADMLGFSLKQAKVMPEEEDYDADKLREHIESAFQYVIKILNGSIPIVRQSVPDTSGSQS